MNESLGLTQAFESLRAELETSWLGDVFLPPRMFNQMTGPYSIMVMGEEGSGKTAVENQLKSYAQKGKSRLIVASWRPYLPENTTSSDDIVNVFLSQALDSLSFAFLQTFAREPVIYTSAPSWIRDFMLWFVQQYLQGDRGYYLDRLIEHASPEGIETVTRLLSEKPRPLFPESVPISILPKLTENVMKLGSEGIWIFVDGLDVLYRISPDRLVQSLDYFLSTLGLFEESAFAFKIFVPTELGQRIQNARGVLTRRFMTYPIKWEENDLIRLVEKRLSLALKHESVVLGKLCKDGDWLEWLKRYAGDSPRVWLELTRPMMEAYIEKGRSISKTEWRDVYRQSPPPLHIDLESGRVFIGGGQISVLGIGYKLLSYLYENRHRPCTKSELYYRAHQGLAHEPRSKEDAGWEDVAIWDGPLDTALYRLRQVVEWDRREGVTPLYVVSERGKGQIRLENTA